LRGSLGGLLGHLGGHLGADLLGIQDGLLGGDPRPAGQRVDPGVQLHLDPPATHAGPRDSRFGCVDRAVAIEIPLPHQFLAGLASRRGRRHHAPAPQAAGRIWLVRRLAVAEPVRRAQGDGEDHGPEHGGPEQAEELR